MTSVTHTRSHILLLYRYHLRDVVVGKIYFLLVRIKIKHMEIAIIKKETSGMRESVVLCHSIITVSQHSVHG